MQLRNATVIVKCWFNFIGVNQSVLRYILKLCHSISNTVTSLSSCWILSSTTLKSFFILEYRLKRVFFTLIGLFCLWTLLPLFPSEKVEKSKMEINHRLCIFINLLLLTGIDEGWRNPSKQSIFNESSNQI